MKKEIKKKLEHALITAMEEILVQQDSKAVDKTKKAVRQAAKSVAKKFSKTIKSLDRKKGAKDKKGKAKGTTSTRRASDQQSPRYARLKNNVISVSPQSGITNPAAAPESTTQENP